MTTTIFLSVSTPAVFHEIEVAEDPANRSPAQKRAVNALYRLAEKHDARVDRSNYRRG